MKLKAILDAIESIKDYKVLFVGDPITDEYHYVKPLGKSSKEYLIPVQYISRETFQGGVNAAANHLRTFCKTVDVCASFGGVRKVRMVEKTEKKEIRKLFEIQYDDHFTRNEDFSRDYDVVVVTDFGHGRISNGMVSRLSNLPYVCVCTQTNASNFGFNLITKYPRADYIVIDEPEARLAASDRESPIKNIMTRLSQGRCDKFVVTHGRYGAYGMQDGFFTSHNSFTDHAIDTMGAGDAFFSITAPISKTTGIDELLVIGNAAGALKCQMVGNQPVTKEALIGFLESRPELD